MQELITNTQILLGLASALIGLAIISTVIFFAVKKSDEALVSAVKKSKLPKRFFVVVRTEREYELFRKYYRELPMFHGKISFNSNSPYSSWSRFILFFDMQKGSISVTCPAYDPRNFDKGSIKILSYNQAAEIIEELEPLTDEE